MSRYALLTFDVEEFDIPLEYRQSINMDEQMKVGAEGLQNIMPVISFYNIACTMFTTANYALHYPEIINNLAAQHEIASHTFFHSSFNNKHLLESRLVLEKFSGTKVTGLRMPRMKKVSMEEVRNAGYTYDSSINPTFIPGRYNNFHLPRKIYKEDGVWRLPVSVSPVIRLPLFWLAFKNYPYKLFLQLCLQCIRKDGYVSLYFHPWEFAEIKKYNLPGYIKNICGQKLIKRLDRLINDLTKEVEFIKMNDFINLSKH